MFLGWEMVFLEVLLLLICLFRGSVVVHVSRVRTGVVGTNVTFGLLFSVDGSPILLPSFVRSRTTKTLLRAVITLVVAVYSNFLPWSIDYFLGLLEGNLHIRMEKCVIIQLPRFKHLHFHVPVFRPPRVNELY